MEGLSDVNNNNGTALSLWEIIFSGKEEETFYEEIANSITHSIGIVLSIFAIYALMLVAIDNRKSKEHVIGCIIYGICLFLLYALSSLYHIVGAVYHHDLSYKESFQKLDHVAIYFMIAGCYTPMALINMVKKGYARSGYLVLACIWFCALAGSSIKLFVGPRNIPDWVSNGFYLFMGWFAVLFGKPIIRSVPSISMWWQFYSGMAYSTGVLFLIWDSLHFNHAIWHIHVMLGSFCGFVGILLSAILCSEHVDTKLSQFRKASDVVYHYFWKKTTENYNYYNTQPASSNQNSKVRKQAKSKTQVVDS